jgi:hypothetical protein
MPISKPAVLPAVLLIWMVVIVVHAGVGGSPPPPHAGCGFGLATRSNDALK